MIGLRKVISSHPLMSGAANRVHAVSVIGRRDAGAAQPRSASAARSSRNDGLLRKRSPMRTGRHELVAVVDRAHRSAAASPSSRMFAAGRTGCGPAGAVALSRAQYGQPGPPVQRHGLSGGHATPASQTYVPRRAPSVTGPSCSRARPDREHVPTASRAMADQVEVRPPKKRESPCIGSPRRDARSRLLLERQRRPGRVPGATGASRLGRLTQRSRSPGNTLVATGRSERIGTPKLSRVPSRHRRPEENRAGRP